MSREFADTLQSLLFNLQTLVDKLLKIRIHGGTIGLVLGQHLVRPSNDCGRDHGQMPGHVQKVRQKRNSLPVQQRHVCATEPEGFDHLHPLLSAGIRSFRGPGNWEIIGYRGGDD